MKKYLLLWGIGILLSISPTTFAFTNQQEDAFYRSREMGFTSATSIEKADFYGAITRAEMAEMLSDFAKNLLWKAQDGSKNCSYSDINSLSKKQQDSIIDACKLWIFSNENQKFKPNDIVNRAEFWTALSRVLWGNTYDWWKPYYAKHLKALKDAGISNYSKYADNILETRWYALLMLKRSHNKNSSKVYSNQNENYSHSGSSFTQNNKINNNETYLTQKEVQNLIEKEEWLKENSLYSNWYECSWESCTYRFEYSIDWKKYIYHRGNKISDKTIKVQDLWISVAEEKALNDAKLTKNNAEVEQSFSTNGYTITITSKDNVFIYSMSLDWKILEKRTLITSQKALETILKETNLTKYQSNIEKENKKICSLSYPFFDNKHDMYQCSFTYWWKIYTSYVNAKDWTFIPIKKTGSSIQYWNSVTWKQNVVISENFTYIDSDKAEEILTEKYNIKNWWLSWTRKMWEWDNAIYVYSTNESEYYIDAMNWTRMNSKDEIIASISKDSWVSQSTIKNSKKDDDDDSMWMDITETNFIDIKTNSIVSIYSFNYQWTTYTYKVRVIDWKILDSAKDSDIWKDKAVELAQKAIQKKHSVTLQDDYEAFDYSRAYIRYLSSTASENYIKTPSEPEYVISFTDKSEENIYRAILKLNGDIVSEDKLSTTEIESNFLAALYYFMWYNLDDLNDLEAIEIWWTFWF